MRRSMGSCSISRRPGERRSWRRGDSNGRVRAEICRRARAGASTGGLGGLGEGTTRPLFLAGLPDLFRQSERGGDGAAGRAEEAEPGKISDLQPAIRDADPRGPADSEGTGPAGGPVDGSETGTAREGGARRRAQRNAALGSLPRAGSLSQNLRHLGDGGRKERQPDGSDGPVRELPEDFAGGPEKGGVNRQHALVIKKVRRNLKLVECVRRKAHRLQPLVWCFSRHADLPQGDERAGRAFLRGVEFHAQLQWFVVQEIFGESQINLP